ncbi:MAG: phenylacetate-CoA oxygenase subunit PaaC [Burkholderiales bacterium]|nr:phenylacetate-CoA oxygenase subunit PaaC [Burkholderiales bacterium]
MPSSTCESVSLAWTPRLAYLLCVADTALIHAQRLAEWCGHAPILEEDIALANIALDHLGQARALLTLAGEREGGGHDEDQLAFLRDEQDFRNLTLAELPLRKGGGDFADTQLRNLLLATWFKLLWQRLQASPDAELAAIAGKAIKEARYHQAHAADWVVRLGDGTAESASRMAAALQRAWPYVAELFELQACDLGPATQDLRAEWRQEIAAILAEAQLAMPVDTAFRSTGLQGLHSEHFGYLLAEMQHLQRAHPGGVW